MSPEIAPLPAPINNSFHLTVITNYSPAGKAGLGHQFVLQTPLAINTPKWLQKNYISFSSVGYLFKIICFFKNKSKF